jgi:hypothetical protein
MDAERWKRMDDLLQAALQVPAERQEGFLRQQCGGDSELLEEVCSLLSSHRKAKSFLDQPGLHVAEIAGELPTLGVTQSGSSSSIAGQTISHYRVLESLGSGGMGGGITNIWRQPLSGGKPTRVTRFNSDEIWDFDLSRDGSQIVLTHGRIDSDVILIRDVR